MEAFTTEEQQVEAIKKFWHDNAVSIIGGITIGLGGVWTYNYYQDQTKIDAETASLEYSSAIEAMADAKVVDKAESFVKTNGDSGYADLAALMLAKTHVEAGALDKAEEQLLWVSKNSSSVELKALASIRLARVVFAKGDAEKALTLLSKPFPKAFEAQISEIKGDIYVSQGEITKAREAYQFSADNGGLEGNQTLKMKLDDLALDAQVVAS